MVLEEFVLEAFEDAGLADDNGNRSYCQHHTNNKDNTDFHNIFLLYLSAIVFNFYIKHSMEGKRVLSLFPSKNV